MTTVTRWAAALFAILTILSAVPPTQADHRLGGFDIELAQGDVTVTQGSSRTFVQQGDQPAVVSARIRNAGAVSVESVPVYFYIKERTDLNGCRLAEHASNAAPRTIPPGGVAWANWSVGMNAAVGLAAGAYNVTVYANERPPSGPTIQNCAGGVTPHQESADLAADEGDNHANGYFVKDRFLDLTVTGIKWCISGVQTLSDCDGKMVHEGAAYNYSRNAGDEASTFFAITVANKGTWHQDRDHGSPGCARIATADDEGCQGFAYNLEVDLDGERIDPNGEDLNGNVVRGVGLKASGSWSLAERAGPYNLTVAIKNVTQTSTANDVGHKTVQVAWTDLFPVFRVADLKTTPTDPYAFSSGIRIRGNVTFFSDGPSRAHEDVHWRVWLGDLPACAGCSGTNVSGTTSNFSRWTVEFNWLGSNDPEDANYLRPGKHTIRAVIDDTAPGNFETNETNNTASVDIYVQDITAPVIDDVRVVTPDPPPPKGVSAALTESPATTLYPGKTIRVRAFVNDTDQGSVAVTVRYTNLHNASVVINDTATQQQTQPFHYVAQTQLPMHGNGTSTNWTLEVIAKDSFLTTTRTIATYRMDVWPIQLEPEDHIVRKFANATVFTWAGSEPINYTLLVRPNATGFYEQHEERDNIRMIVTSPDNKTTIHDGIEWVPWDTVNTPSECPQVASARPTCDRAFHFETLVDKSVGMPGTWNVSIQVADLSGAVRTINRTFIVQDALPEFVVSKLTADTVAARDLVNVTALVRDDFTEEPVKVFLNLTREQGGYANFSLGEPLPLQVEGAHQYELSITTGRGGMLGLAGNYSGVFSAVDQNGNWRRNFTLAWLNITDTQAPTLDAGAGPDRSTQEIGLAVTWKARPQDESNVTVVLSVLRGSENLFAPVELVPGLDGNHTHTVNISTQGNYVWKLQAIDSLGRRSEPAVEGILAIHDNLGPKFEIRAPSVAIEGQRYARAQPRVEVLVYDADGVAPSTITMEVNGATQSLRPVYVTSPIPGYLVAYDAPASRRFAHGERVTVNLTAGDNSTKALVGYLNFTFVVDDVAPIARAEEFAPSYRATELDEHNVSFQTTFRLRAEDPDGLEHKQLTIRLRVYQLRGNTVDAVYTGPFGLKDVIGPDARPGAYTIQYWAEDDVGNPNATKQTIHVYVDDTPPYYDQFGPEPRDQFVNVSLGDDRSGVDRAVVWYKLNNATPKSIEMDYSDGVWRAVLPEGRKGDTISYHLQAWDGVDNTDRIWVEEPRTYRAGNHAPVVSIASPAEGSVLTRAVPFKYAGSDEDGEALVFTLEISGPDGLWGEVDRKEAPTLGEYSGEHVLDTTRYSDGDYKLRLKVSDGSAVSIAERSFSIRNKANAIHTVLFDGGILQPGGSAAGRTGEGAVIEVQLTKADVRSVEAIVIAGGSPMTSFALRDDGVAPDRAADDDIYTGSVVMDEPGEYQLKVVTTYGEGGATQTEESSAVAFSVDPTSAYIASTYGGLIGAIVLAGLATAGLALWAILRRR